MRVYDDFINRYFSSEPEGYGFLSFYGRRKNSDEMIIVREAPDIVARHQADVVNLTYDRKKEVDTSGYLVAITDGVTTTEWFAAEAGWEIAPAYWITHKTPEDKLILYLKPVIASAEDEPRSAELCLTRQGGTLRFRGENTPGELKGEQSFESGPRFLADPLA